MERFNREDFSTRGSGLRNPDIEDKRERLESRRNKLEKELREAMKEFKEQMVALGKTMGEKFLDPNSDTEQDLKEYQEAIDILRQPINECSAALNSMREQFAQLREDEIEFEKIKDKLLNDDPDLYSEATGKN
jgi:chromosome segregation ATPase